MTYKEKYMKFSTLEELIEKSKTDIAIAMILNPDKVNAINEAITEVVKEKRW